MTAPGAVRRAVRHGVQTVSRTPLRWRLLAVVLVLSMVSLAITMVLSSFFVTRYLVGQKGDELRAYAKSLPEFAAGQDAWYQMTGRRDLPTGFTLRYIPAGSHLQYEYGHAVTESADVEIPDLQPTDPRVTSGEPFELGSKTGNVRWLAIALTDADKDTVAVLALPMTGLEATVKQFRWYALLIGLFVAAVVGVLGHFLVRRAFRPLSRIESTAAEIARGDLSRRVAVSPARDEVASLGRSLNAMLGTIEQSFLHQEQSEERMRRFVADASHELRTPLAAVTGYAELYRQGALPDDEAVAGAMSRIEGEGTRMKGLVEDLLTLARLDEETPLSLGAVDLAVVAADAAQDARTIDPTRKVTVGGIEGRPLGPTMIVADDRRIRQVVANLLSNARSHTPEGTAVDVLVGMTGPRSVSLVVRDHGPGIPEEERAQVFERFYRSDKARTRARGGNGLGLAIVAAIVASHGGRVRAEQTPGGGATIVVDLPVNPNPTDAAQELTGESKVPHGHP